jgi:hypothetical protein
VIAVLLARSHASDGGWVPPPASSPAADGVLLPGRPRHPVDDDEQEPLVDTWDEIAEKLEGAEPATEDDVPWRFPVRTPLERD